MSEAVRRYADEVRRTAASEARKRPQPQRYSVIDSHPLQLESLSSDARLTEGDDDFEIADDLDQDSLALGDTVLVLTDGNQESVAMAKVAPEGAATTSVGGLWGYHVPEGVYARVSAGQYMIIPPEGLEIDGYLDFDGIELHLEELTNP